MGSITWQHAASEARSRTRTRTARLSGEQPGLRVATVSAMAGLADDSERCTPIDSTSYVRTFESGSEALRCTDNTTKNGGGEPEGLPAAVSNEPQ